MLQTGRWRYTASFSDFVLHSLYTLFNPRPIPFYIPLTFLLAKWLVDMDFDNAASIIFRISILSIFPAGIFYIVARVFTLALAFTSLRDLPHGAFDTVHWTTFIPHV